MWKWSPEGTERQCFWEVEFRLDYCQGEQIGAEQPRNTLPSMHQRRQSHDRKRAEQLTVRRVNCKSVSKLLVVDNRLFTCVSVTLQSKQHFYRFLDMSRYIYLLLNTVFACSWTSFPVSLKSSNTDNLRTTKFLQKCVTLECVQLSMFTSCIDMFP